MNVVDDVIYQRRILLLYFPFFIHHKNITHVEVPRGRVQGNNINVSNIGATEQHIFTIYSFPSVIKHES